MSNFGSTDKHSLILQNFSREFANPHLTPAQLASLQSQFDAYNASLLSERDAADSKARESEKQREIENAALVEKFRAEDAAKARREADQLKSDLRADFLAKNPSASEQDFERLYPSLRDEHFRRTMFENDESFSRNFNFMKQSGHFERM